MDTINPVIFYFLCYSDYSVSTYLFPLSFLSCCSGWTLYIQLFSISSATRVTVCLLIYFPFPFLPAVWLDTIYPVIFYFLCFLDHSESTYVFLLSFPSFCSEWTLYVQSLSISSATRITVSLLNYFPFPFLPSVLDGDYMSRHFLFLLLLGSQNVYLFIFHNLYFLLFWLDTICSVIFFFLSYSDQSKSTYLFSLHFISCCSGWILYIHSFSISYAIRITVSLLIYFPFPFLTAVWLDTIYQVIFFATWFTVSTYLFLLSFPSCSY